MLKTILLVGLGGGAGSIFRYLTSYWFGKYTTSSFPFATFIVNILGCLLIGLLIGFFMRNGQFNYDLRALLVVGFCGGYTTFSAFSLESLNLFQSNPLLALIYILGSIVLGLAAVLLGMNIVK